MSEQLYSANHEKGWQYLSVGWLGDSVPAQGPSWS
jgi:hypothetical protein